MLDDYSRYILAWKLTPTMAATDVQETLELTLARTRYDRVRVRHRPRLLSDNGPCHVSGELRRCLESRDARQDRALASLDEKPGPTAELRLPTGP